MAPTPETYSSTAPEAMMSGYMGTSDSPYKAAPVAAIVVPVVLIVVIIVLGILIAFFLYRRRAYTDRDRIIAASTPKAQRSKRLPGWLTSWTGSIRSTKPLAGGLATSRTVSRTSSDGSLHKPPQLELSGLGNDSDVIALRPAELPAAPRPAYESRHAAFGFGGVRPKSLAVAF